MILEIAQDQLTNQQAITIICILIASFIAIIIIASFIAIIIIASFIAIIIWGKAALLNKDGNKVKEQDIDEHINGQL